MLYSLLVAVIVLSFFNALIVPFLTVRYFIKGLNINTTEKVALTGVKEVVEGIKPKKKPKPDKYTEALLKNIDRYDGTGLGQEVIK